MHHFLAIAALIAGLGVSSCNDSNFSGGSGKATPTEKPKKVQSEDAKKPVSDGDKPSLGEQNEPDEEADENTAGDAPEVTAEDNVLANIDSNCANGKTEFLGGIFSGPVAPKVTLSKTVPSSCNGGIEFNNLKNSSFTISAKSALKNTAPLDIEIASYAAADRMRVIAIFKDGTRKVMLDSCRLRTATYTDPTNGNQRPPEDSIRDFRMKVPKGTASLEFDFTAAPTPTYMKVNGLCDFNLTPDSVNGSQPNIRKS